MELGEYFYALADYEEAVLWFINASTEAPSILDIHASGDLPLLGLSNCYNELAKSAQYNQDFELYNTYISNANQYLEAANNWEMPVEL